MTNHPLTDRKLFVQFLTLGRDYYPDNLNGFSYDDMRDVADWQLEQCIAWLDDNDCDDPQETAQRLKEAMRPTNTQEDNDD